MIRTRTAQDLIYGLSLQVDGNVEIDLQIDMAQADHLVVKRGTFVGAVKSCQSSFA